MLDGSIWSSGFAFYCVAWTLFLADSAIRLHINEVVFVGKPNGRWRTRTSARLPLFGRKYLFVLSPLLPGHVGLTRSWPATHSGPGRHVQLHTALQHLARELRWLRWFSAAALLQIFLLMPALYIRIGSVAAVIAIGLLYIQTLGVLTWLAFYWRRHVLPWSRYARLAFDSLICIPYAVNLYRKAFTTAAGQEGTFDDFWRMTESQSREDALVELGQLIDFEVDRCEGRPERVKALQAFRVTLAGN